MSSPPSSFLSTKTKQNVKNSVIAALTTLSIVAETVPIPGAKVPAAALLELIKAVEKMNANTEALEQLHQSLLELISIFDKTKVGPNVTEELKQNVQRLFEKICATAHQWSELRTGRSRFSRFINRDDISDDIRRLNEDIRAACAIFMMIGSIDTQRSIGATQDAVGVNHREILNAQEAIEVSYRGIVNTRQAVEVGREEIVSTMHLDKLPHIDEAIYNHVSREGAPICVPGSRDSLLEKIKHWTNNLQKESPSIFWLSGIAGAGKSTIAQTVCVNAAELKILGGTFFFSQQEGQRRVANAVFPTLIYQLLSNPESPGSIKICILKSLDKNPSAASKLLQIQFEKLIAEPLHNLSLSNPIVLVLDALDECTEDGIKEVLRLIMSNLEQLPSFLKIFVTSRPESHIADILNPKNPSIVQKNRRIYQHEIDPSSDENAVRVFFETALSNSEVARLFPAFADWSLSEEQITRLVKITEGLFIVAATIVKFILNSAEADPVYCLSVLLQDPDSQVQTHSAINLLYIKVLEHRYPSSTQKRTLDRFREVVGSIVLLFEPLSIDSLGQLLELPPPTISSALHRLQSVVAVTPADNLARPQHPSFVNFITNRQTCPPHFLVDSPRQHAFLAQRCIIMMNKLFDNGRESNKADITPEVTYALCYLDDHIIASSPEYKEEFLTFIKSFVNSRVAKWLVALFHAGRAAHAIPSAKQLRGWITDCFPDETEVATLLKDLSWCIAQFYDDWGRRIAELGKQTEALDWWLASNDAYLQLCATREDFHRETPFRLALDGRFEIVKLTGLQERGVDESKRVIKELITHRSSLSWRPDTMQQFLAKLDSSLASHQLELAVSATEHQINIIRTMGSSFKVTLARALHVQGINLKNLGQWGEAVKITQEWVKLSQELFVANPEKYRVELADSLYKLGLYRSDLKEWKTAVEVTSQAVELYQVLYAAEPETHRFELSRALYNLGYYHSNLHEWERAVEATSRAVELRRILFTADPDTYRSDLSRALNNLGYYCSNLHEWEGAVEVMNQAVSLRQVLFNLDPDTHRSNLSDTLNSLGYYHSQLNQWGRAVETTSQAVELYQVLFATDPERYRSSLSHSLYSLGYYQSMLEEWEGAVEATSQAAELRQVLFNLDPDTHCSDLSDTLASLHIFRSHLKQWLGAVEAGGRVVELQQVMYDADQEKYREILSDSLYRLATYRSKLEHWAGASQAMEQAVVLREVLFAAAPDTYRMDLAEALHFLEFFQSQLGDQSGAAKTLRRIIELREILATSDSTAHRAALALPCNTLAWFLRDSGRPEQGLKYVLDAITIFRTASSKDELDLVYYLSASLDTAAACMHDVGRSREALAYSEEAIALLRSCVELAPSDSSYRTTLFDVAGVYSNILKSLGETEKAEEITREMGELRERGILAN